jgi:hypothetical protein
MSAAWLRCPYEAGLTDEVEQALEEGRIVRLFESGAT